MEQRTTKGTEAFKGSNLLATIHERFGKLERVSGEGESKISLVETNAWSADGGYGVILSEVIGPQSRGYLFCEIPRNEDSAAERVRLFAKAFRHSGKRIVDTFLDVQEGLGGVYWEAAA